ncbi:MAG: ABC transporter permease [Candidatus Methanofastidiosia archaeon]
MAIRSSMWLEYQIEANWTSPVIFILYNTLKPVGGSLLLLAMYYVVTGGFLGGEGLYFLYIGNAFYMLVAQTLFNVGWIIHDDREHYQTMKYLYISPLSYFMYLMGRSAMRFLLSLLPLSVLIFLGIFLKIPYHIEIPLLIGTFFLGWIFVISAGLLLSGINMLTARHGNSVGQAFSGIFYLFSGVVFPINILPVWASTVALGLPSTYWFSLVRRSVLGKEIDSIMSGFTTGEVAVRLIIISVVFFVISYLTFRLADYLARKKGIIDMTTTY